MELGDAVRMSSRSGGGQAVMTQQSGAPSASVGQLGVLQVLRDHQIDASKYKVYSATKGPSLLLSNYLTPLYVIYKIKS